MKKINIVSNNCITPDGEVLGGGVERWTIELAETLKQANYKVTVYQRSNVNKTVLVRGISFVLIKVSLPNLIGNFSFSKKLNSIVDHNCKTIFVSHDLMYGSKVKHKIGVNHGNWWNGDFGFLKLFIVRFLQKKLLKKSDKVICVDTNFINWCNDNLSNKSKFINKLVYIPNYADLEKFSFKKKKLTKNKITLLYPRRLNFSNLQNNPRGLGLYLQALKYLDKDKYFLKFLGRGEEQQLLLEDLLIKQGYSLDSFEITDVGLDEMPFQYQESDIVVIPSTAQEGTSFSALESMASGCATVVTYVGGLPNIIINKYNGILCDVDPESFANGIKEAEKQFEFISANCENSRVFFSKARWDKQILDCIN